MSQYSPVGMGLCGGTILLLVHLVYRWWPVCRTCSIGNALWMAPHSNLWRHAHPRMLVVQGFRRRVLLCQGRLVVFG